MAQTLTTSIESRQDASLKQFIDIRRLLEMRQSLRELTRLNLTIRDNEGHSLEADPHEQQSVYEDNPISEAAQEAFAANLDDAYVAPITIDGKLFGTIAIEAEDETAFDLAVDRLDALARQHAIPTDQRDLLKRMLTEALALNRDAAQQLFYLWANGIVRACVQEYELRMRVEELTALQTVSRVMSAERNLQVVMDVAARSVAEVMKVKAASIRLVSEDGSEFEMKAGYNLSAEYLAKGPSLIDQNELARQTMEGQIIHVADMSTDPRIVYRDAARKEGLVSMLGAPLRYEHRTCGVLRIYTDEPRRFFGI